jgi:hypothetical protein
MAVGRRVRLRLAQLFLFHGAAVSVRFLVGGARAKRLPSGRFAKGVRAAPATEFKPGQHWRPRRPHWDREWLVREYVERQRSSGEIAADIGCTDLNVIYWLRKHGIARRTMAGVRAIKHWGVSGKANPMFGKTGELKPALH